MASNCSCLCHLHRVGANSAITLQEFLLSLTLCAIEKAKLKSGKETRIMGADIR
jgi:hypothetical protein